MNRITDDRSEYKRLDFSMLRFSSAPKQTIENVTPIDWSKDVLSGKKKVLITQTSHINFSYAP